jgi:hypothetical protein
MNTGKRLGLWLFLALTAWGCAGVSEKYPSDEAKAYFAAAKEANFLGVECMSSPQHVDLSAYTSLMGVKYPPTVAVEVLSEPPSRPYQAFAVLQSPASQSSQNVSPTILAQLTNKAKAIGADAIIICRAPTDKAEVVAIKYRLEPPAEKARH